MPFQINTDRPVGPPFFPGPIIQANDARRDGRGQLIPMEEPELGAGTRRQRKLLAKARAPQPADRKRKGLQGGG